MIQKNIGNFKSDFYRRLAFDEILASFLISSEIRKNIKKIKKKSKKFSQQPFITTIKKLNFNLTTPYYNKFTPKFHLKSSNFHLNFT